MKHTYTLTIADKKLTAKVEGSRFTITSNVVEVDQRLTTTQMLYQVRQLLADGYKGGKDDPRTNPQNCRAYPRRAERQKGAKLGQ